MAKFKPYKILESQLDSLPIKEGQFILTTDTKKLYSDTAANTRILISPDAITDLSVDGTTITYTHLDGTTGMINTQDTTYSVASETKNGLMSADDKAKLNAIDAGAQKNTITGVKGDSETLYRTGNVNITKANIGLNNVENKSSATIRGELTSANVTTALGYTPLNGNLKGANNGLAELDANGKVPTAQLPSYVDDVLEYSAKANFPTTGETGKIYVDTSTNKTYRWGGSAYVEISPSIALGTTSSTAFRGDYGQAAYTHAVTNKGSKFDSGLYKIATNAEGHVTGATAVVKGDITALGIPAQDTTYSAATTSAAGLMSAADKTKLDGIAAGAQKNTITGVKGNAETSYRTGNVNITKGNIGLGNVDNTADADKSVKSAVSATKDSASQQINTTYIKSVSVPGRKITLTKGDGTTTSVENFTTTVNTNTANIWVKLGTFNNQTQGEGGEIWLFGGNGQNNATNQNMWAHLFIKKGYQGSTPSTTNYVAATYEIFTPPSCAANYKNVKFKVFCTEIGVVDVWVYFPYTYSRSYYYPAGQYDSFTVANTYQTEEPVAGDTYGVLQPISGGIIASSSNGTSIDNVIKGLSISGKTITYTKGDDTTGTLITQDTTYTGENGVTVSGTKISNSGVRSISTGSTNGTISVNTNGTSAEVAVKGVSAAAYKGIDTSIAAASTSTNLPTSKAVASFVEGKGYKTTDNNTTYTLTQDATDGHKITLTPSSGNATTITIPDKDTTYTFSNGLSASGTTVSNSGVRSIATGTANGTISVNTNGTAANVAVKGLGSLAYKSSLSASDVGALASTLKGAASGVAELDSSGKVPSAQLPSYVDDVLEYAAKANFPATGETGKIYVDLATNKTYRWSGSAYVEISPSLALGTTSSTAYRGDYGNTAYTHATAKGSAFAAGLYKITTNAQGHVTAATAVAKADITGLGIPGSDTKNTAGSTDTSSKIFLVGATSQAANPQTYSDNEVYATNGVLSSKALSINAKVNLEYDATNGGLKVVFA